MNWLDLVIVGVVAWTTFRAFSTGLIREVVALGSLVAGIVLSGAFYDNLSANLEFAIADPVTRHLAAFAAIFCGTMVAGYVLASVLHTAAALLFLGPLDRLGGAAFGLVKGLVLAQVALVAISVFPVQASLAEAVRTSTLAPILLRFAPAVRIGLPAEFQDPLSRLQLQAIQGVLQGVAPALPGGAPKP